MKITLTSPHLAFAGPLLLALALPLGGCAKQSADNHLIEGGPEPVAVVEPTPTFEKDRVDGKVEHNVDVIDTALNYAHADEFVAALREAGLEGELRQTDTLYTLFVPADADFDRAKLGNDKAELTRLMRYYVVPGRLTSAELTSLATAPTGSGEALDILADPKGAYIVVNQARVLDPNVEATNGVVHVIDAMLLPPDHPGAAALRDEAPSASINVDPAILGVCGVGKPRAFFALDSAKVRMAADDELKALAACITSGPLAGEVLQVVGFTDPRGSAAYNKTLGARRAGAVADTLKEFGVPAKQLKEASRGESQAHDESPRFWDFDRRVDISLAPSKKKAR